MDALLARLGVQALNYAIRSGIALTSTYAIGQCSRLLKTVDDHGLHAELQALQELLNSKIKIISPAIDLVEFKAGRGNVFLESALPLTKSLHHDIISLGRLLERAASTYEALQRGRGMTDRLASDRTIKLQDIITRVKNLLARIDNDIPLLQLAITGSGESLSNTLPPGISPSRLLQASTFLIVADTQYARYPTMPVQVGPTFTLSLYMLFLGHAVDLSSASRQSSDENLGSANEKSPRTTNAHAHLYGPEVGDRKPIWQEVIHKVRVRLCRTPVDFVFDPVYGYRRIASHGLSTSNEVGLEPHLLLGNSQYDRPSEYAYHLELVEDLDDGRAHEVNEKIDTRFDDLPRAGIRESILIHQISKIFYTDTGRILNIGSMMEGESNPVLLLKRDSHAGPPMRRSEESDPTTQLLKSLEEGTAHDAGLADSLSDSESHIQDDVSRQLLRESTTAGSELQIPMPVGSSRHEASLAFPRHLDPEWIALEAFDDAEAEDDDVSSNASSSLGDKANTSYHHGDGETKARTSPRNRVSLDSRLVSQIQSLTLETRQSETASNSRTESLPSERPVVEFERDSAAARGAGFMARSPFGAVTSSLSLLEMLIRLTSLQEFQQASHLSIPDHLLTFFLEETSTTGLRGEAKWRAKKQAKRRMGFDPYTDSPIKKQP